MKDQEQAMVEELYKKVETQIDELQVGGTVEYAAPEFNAEQILTILKIIEYLKKNKYHNTISFITPTAMRIVVTKLKEQETSVFSNLIIEKSAQEIEAEKAYENCSRHKHELKELKSPSGFPILVCNNCRVKYTFKLTVGGRKLASVSPL